MNSVYEDADLEAAAEALENDFESNELDDSGLESVDRGEGIATDGGRDYQSQAVRGYMGASAISGLAALKELGYDLPQAAEVAQYTGDLTAMSDEVAAGTAFAIGSYAFAKKALELRSE